MYNITKKISTIKWIFILIWVFVGILVIIHIVHITDQKKRCTNLITATVIGLKEHNISDSTTYSPIYHFWFNGVEYTVTTRSSRNFALPEIGSQQQLYINPKEPNDFYKPSTGNTIFFLLFGGIVLLFGIILFIFLLPPFKSNITSNKPNSSFSNKK